METSQGNVAALSRWQSVWLLVFSLCGLFAAFMLLQSELKVLNSPEAQLGCDVNPLIGCSTSLLSPQAHLFGTPNAVIGLGAFVALLTLSVLLLSGVRLPRWIWYGMSIGTIIGVGYVAYFLYLSATLFRTLCPYCMLTWFGVLGAFVIVWAHVLNEGLIFGKPVGAARKYWWLVLLALCLIVLLVVVLTLGDKIAMVL